MPEQASNDDATPLLSSGVKPEKKRKFYPHYTIAAMCFAAYMLVCLMRFNLSIAITVMVKRNTSEQVYDVNISLTEDKTIGEFDWDAKTQQMVLGAFFYGYAVMPLLAGYLANRIGGKTLVGFSVLWPSVMAALTPWAARTNVGLLVFVRVLSGLGQSALVPGIFQIVQMWSPENELTTMVILACSGKYVGLILSSIVSPWLCSSTLLGGWPLSFYVYSWLGFVWTMVWIVWASDSPTTYQWKLSSETKQFYDAIPERRKSAKTSRVPWRQMLTSLPVWALVISDFGTSFGLNLWITNIPIFVTTIFGLDLQTCGLLTSLAFLMQLIMSIGVSMFSDYVLFKGYVEVNTLRKSLVTLGLGVTSISTLSLGYIPDGLLVFMLVCCLGFYSCTSTGILPTPLDVAPNYAAIISGAMSIACNSSGFVVTLILGALIEEKNSISEWRIMFQIIAGVQILTLFVFLIFGSAKQQDWAKGDNEQQDENMVELTK